MGKRRWRSFQKKVCVFYVCVCTGTPQSQMDSQDSATSPPVLFILPTMPRCALLPCIIIVLYIQKKKKKSTHTPDMHSFTAAFWMHALPNTSHGIMGHFRHTADKNISFTNYPNGERSEYNPRSTQALLFYIPLNEVNDVVISCQVDWEKPLLTNASKLSMDIYFAHASIWWSGPRIITRILRLFQGVKEDMKARGKKARTQRSLNRVSKNDCCQVVSSESVQGTESGMFLFLMLEPRLTLSKSSRTYSCLLVTGGTGASSLSMRLIRLTVLILIGKCARGDGVWISHASRSAYLVYPAPYLWFGLDLQIHKQILALTRILVEIRRFNVCSGSLPVG